MNPSRRTFLGAAAGLFAAGPARASFHDWLIARRYAMVDEDVAKYRGPVQGNGFLDQPAYAMDDCERLPQVPYCPQPGDVMLSQTRGWLYTVGHTLSGAVQPSHSGFVARKADGSIVIMEAGSFDVAVIRGLPLVEHLSAYHNRKHVWIRPRCVPLTPEQACRLTAFAEKQEGKRFARARVYGQWTPLRSRGKLKTELFGGPHGPDRATYFCAEMVTEAFVYAGLIPAEDARPAATYPCDLFFDESKIPFLNRHFKLGRFGWGVPCRWRPLPLTT
jgi:hypothetical protein